MRYLRRPRLNYAGFVDDGLALEMNRLLQSFDLLPGKRVSGTLRWPTEFGSSSASYEASLLNPKRAWLRLSYTIAYFPNGTIIHQDYRIRLTTTRTHLGGTRWWFRCPVTQLRTAKLYLPSNGVRFLSRRAYSTLRPLGHRLLAQVREHVVWRDQSDPKPARASSPALVLARSAVAAKAAGNAGLDSDKIRRIYAERLGRPAPRPRGLMPEEGC